MPRRLVSQVTDVELRHFCRERTPCGYAWRIASKLVLKRDLRGAKKWLFAMGYLSATADNRDFFKNIRQTLDRVNGVELDRLEAYWRASSGLDILGTEDPERTTRSE